MADNLVFPAPAGINRHVRNQESPDGSVPRASGDKPLQLNSVLDVDPCSPRQRG
ncbi:hypothetical protein HHY15_000516 [Salmonella enterica]|nr:hypothetical protein [Salmonella enterica]EGH6264154.1 hypothetical protein [Salmonella enterica]